MSLTFERVEALAPDQGSLSAARKLLKPSSWPTLATGEGFLWGECQGSGATPYRVVISEADAGYKCTCPSRKFPCKHSLAMMWMRAEGKTPFAAAAPPEWVKDWSSRRRGPAREAAAVDGDAPPKARPSIQLTEPEGEGPADVAAGQRSAAAREKNRQAREAAVLEGLEQLDVWLSDQVESGMANFVSQCTQACRRIAQRLVDAKAPGLASRLDALPTLLFTMPEPQRPRAAVSELGQIHLLSKAYRRADCLDEDLTADVRQMVGWPVTREALLSDPGAIRVKADWRVIAVIVEAQPDRLRRVETWLLGEDVEAGRPQAAVLLDFVPVSAGAPSSGYLVGDRIHAELVFYRSPAPTRALIATVAEGAQACAEPLRTQPVTLAEAYVDYERALARLPWLGSYPLVFRQASIRRKDEALYVADDQGLALPLHSAQAVSALPLTTVGPVDGVGLWDGYAFTLLWAETRLGRWVRT